MNQDPESKISDLVSELKNQNFVFNELNIDLTKLISFTNLILKWNNSHDLVSQKSFDEIFDHHILDSIGAFIVYKSINPETPDSYIDIGSGAGLPGIVWHLCFNETIPCKLVEPRIKRINFLKEVRQSLSLKKLELEESRFTQTNFNSKIIHASLRALRPDETMLKNICINSPKNRVIWLGGVKSETNFQIENLISSNHDYTIEHKEQYKRVLINFRNNIPEE